MAELRDEEDGRLNLIMDKKELPLAVEGLMPAGYELTPLYLRAGDSGGANRC